MDIHIRPAGALSPLWKNNFDLKQLVLILLLFKVKILGMSKKNISRKQALKQLGGLAVGSQLMFPFLSFNRGDGREVAPLSSSRKKPLVKNSKQPHIIFIMTDQQRADALGCAGNPAVKTPHIDMLAGEGVLFSQTYSPVPSCTPARSCLLTGMTPWNNGMLGYGRVARQYKYELPRMLREGGYYTFCVGKNHWFPQKSLHGFNGTLVDESGRIEQDGYVSDYRDWFRFKAPGKDPDKTGLGWNSRMAKAYALDEALHPTSWIGSKALDFLDSYNLDVPLFLKVSFERPHSPYDPPQACLDRYKDTNVPGPATGDWEGEIYNYPDKNKPIPTTGPPTAAFGNFGEEQVKESKKHYYANISFIDDQVGKLIAKLKERGMYENAVICFLSDHGDEMGDHYHWRKTFPYQGSVHIPFILRWPDNFNAAIQRGSQIEEPVGLQDMLPTFLDASGQKIPEDMDGMSVLDLVRGDAKGWRKYIGMEHATCYFENNYWSSVTDGKAKYIWHFRTGQEQFFDLTKDPHENKDLAKVPARKKEVQLWRSRLVQYLEERGPGFVKNGMPVKRSKTMLYSPHHPQSDENDPKWLRDWRKKENGSFTPGKG
jgi:arylsulfatase A-like enzyme